MSNIIKKPNLLIIETKKEDFKLNLIKDESKIADIEVNFNIINDNQMDIFLKAEKSRIKYIKLRWNIDINITEHTKILSDTFERAYGDLEWKGMQPDRFMPWYFLKNEDNTTIGYGVKVRANAFCFWQMDLQGITLWLDVRNGTKGVNLLDRELKICSIVNLEYKNINSFLASKEFCKKMCDDAIFPKEPIYGFNNWYYAYGNISEDMVIRDTIELSKIVNNNIKNKPFMVIDDGWQVAHKLNEYNGGPWYKGNEKFPDMKKLAYKIKENNCRPGIWVRLLHTSDKQLPINWRLKKDNNILDISVPEFLDYIANIIKDITDWGYELIKHDFSTVDILGYWGFELNPSKIEKEWSFYDETKTTAELIIQFYSKILEATNNKSYILGCNCIGYLGAGLMHLQRVGDDVSGICWERTRKYGINTLAFRLSQHKTFFDIDVDCVGITEEIPWELNKKWAELVANSGTPMFISANLTKLNKEQIDYLKRLLEINSKQTDIIEPIDWTNNTCPSTWNINGNLKKYDWYEEIGISKFIV